MSADNTSYEYTWWKIKVGSRKMLPNNNKNVRLEVCNLPVNLSKYGDRPRKDIRASDLTQNIRAQSTADIALRFSTCRCQKKLFMCIKQFLALRLI
jgi:hypothetical protein